MNIYRYTNYLYKPKRKKKKLFVGVFLVLLVVGGIVYSVFFVDLYSFYSRILDVYRITFNDFRYLERNLEEGNYNIVIHEGLPYLEKRPYDSRLLRYIGEAYYYISTGLIGAEKEKSLD
ncbi:MAG: hypothetical protein ACOC7U_09725, partial [Spirochaetota bacterium]